MIMDKRETTSYGTGFPNCFQLVSIVGPGGVGGPRQKAFEFLRDQVDHIVMSDGQMIQGQVC